MTAPLRDRVFRDPVHGLIELRGTEDRAISALLDTRAMQRLRRIKQMGFAWLVYPGAEHSRFGHALGAFHVAQRALAQLRLTPEQALHLKVAALLHDIGHGPFSHAWEHVFPGASHEQWGARIVGEDAELRGVLEGLAPEMPKILCSFWDKTYRPHFARKLVSSQLDVDRLDYLLRDGHYSGAGYATFDLDWILHAIQVGQVRNDEQDPTDLVIDYRRGMYAVEQYLFARSYMYAQVYHHKTVRAAEWMFIKAMERFSALARQGAEPPGLSVAAKRLAPIALEAATARFGAAAPYYFHVDQARQVGYRAGDEEELHVIDHPRYGAVTLGRLLEDMPLGQPATTVRLVCAPELVDELRPAVEQALALGRQRGRR